MTIDLFQGVSETTRTACRAAVASLLAILISPWVTAQRPYWTILIAVVVINDTWGSSLRKTWHRVGMTGAGCVAGWALHFVSNGHVALERALLLLSIFFAAYFRKSSYPWMTFFITVYVAFLFTVLGQWSASLMLIRLEDTVLGAAIAIAASLIVPAPRVAHRLEEELAVFWKSCCEQVDEGFRILAGADTMEGDWKESRRELLRHAEQLQMSAKETDYERFWRFRSLQRDRRIVRNTVMLCHQALGFNRTSRLSQSRFEDLRTLQVATLALFNQLSLAKVEPGSHLPEPAWPEGCADPVAYFGSRVDELLREIYRDL